MGGHYAGPRVPHVPGPGPRTRHFSWAAARAAGGEKVFRSRDRGESWEDITPAHEYGMSVAEDSDGLIYLGSARGRPNTWLRESGADAAIYRSRSAGDGWEPAIVRLGGGVMSMCAAPDGRGVIAGTSNGELIAVDAKRARVVAAGLACLTAVAAGGGAR